jgi:SOS-response transcriptional repressor LexA
MGSDHRATVTSLTPRRKQAYEFIRGYVDRHGVSPTYDEIAQHLGVGKVAVFELVSGLERSGLVMRAARQQRCIRLVDPRKRGESELAACAMKLRKLLPYVGDQSHVGTEIRDVVARLGRVAV